MFKPGYCCCQFIELSPLLDAVRYSLECKPAMYTVKFPLLCSSLLFRFGITACRDRQVASLFVGILWNSAVADEMLPFGIVAVL
jgi:hypothetical protein